MLLLVQVLSRAPRLDRLLCVFIRQYFTALGSTAISTVKTGLALWTEIVQVISRIALLTDVR